MHFNIYFNDKFRLQINNLSDIMFDELNDLVDM